jgi:tape measure domain-containing protein
MTVVGEAVVVVKSKDEFSKAITDNIAPAIWKLRDGMGSIGDTIKQKIGAGVQTVATITAGVVTATAGVTASIVAQGVEYNVLMQKARAAFTTVLGSAQAADDMLDSIQRFASTSPFPRQVFIEATQQMLGFGIAADDVIPILGSVQDAVAAAGGGADDISSIVNALSQVQSQGKFTGDALMQLSTRGINAADLIGAQMGKTGAEIKKQISDGALGAEEGIAALTAGMKEKFGGAAENLKGTWVGAMDSIKGATRDMGSALVAPFIDPKGGGYAVEWAGIISGKIRDLTDVIVPIFESMFDRIKPIFDKITKAAEDMDLGKMFSDISDTVGDLAPVLAPIAAALTAMGGANIAGMLGPLGSMLGPLANINPIFAAVVALVAVMPELQDAFKEILPILADAGKQLIETFGPAIEDMMPLVHELADFIGGVLVSAFEQLVPPITDLIIQLEPLLPMFSDFISVLITGLGPILSVVIGLISTLLGWISQVPGLMPGIVLAFVAWNLVLAANPILLIVTGIALLIGGLILLWPTIQEGVGKLAEFGTSMKENFLDAFNNVIAMVTALPGKIAEGLGNIWGAVSEKFTSFFSAARDAAGNFVTNFINFWTQLPGKIANGIGSIWGSVREHFTSLFESMRTNVSEGVDKVKDFFAKLPGQMANALGSIWSAISGKFSDLFSSLKTRVSTGVTEAKTTMAELPGKLADALGGLAGAVGGAIDRGLSGIKGRVQGAFAGASGWLTDAGRNIIAGLASGIMGALDGLLTQVRSIAGKIKDAKGPEDYDKRLLIPTGGWIMGGLIKGIDNSMPALMSSLANVTGAIAGTQGDLNAGLATGTGYSAGGKQVNLFPNSTVIMGGESDADAIVKRLEIVVAGSRL